MTDNGRMLSSPKRQQECVELARQAPHHWLARQAPHHWLVRKAPHHWLRRAVLLCAHNDHMQPTAKQLLLGLHHINTFLRDGNVCTKPTHCTSCSRFSTSLLLIIESSCFAHLCNINAKLRACAQPVDVGSISEELLRST